MSRYDWRSQASCRDHDPELWWPVAAEGTPLYEEQAAPAKEICWRCPALGACLAEALDRGESDGVFGGTTPLERRKLRRRAKAVSA